jgi:3-methyladenine DNA glycosylase AlkD
MKYFIDDSHIDELFGFYDSIHHDGYYVKMAVAWAVSFCFVAYPEKTIEYLKRAKLDDFTYNKSIQKTIESYRVDEEMKMRLRAMRRK